MKNIKFKKLSLCLYAWKSGEIHSIYDINDPISADLHITSIHKTSIYKYYYYLMNIHEQYSNLIG